MHCWRAEGNPMTLADNPDWKRYLRVCRERQQHPSLDGFIKWRIYTESNGERWENTKRQESMILVTS